MEVIGAVPVPGRRGPALGEDDGRIWKEKEKGGRVKKTEGTEPSSTAAT